MLLGALTTVLNLALVVLAFSAIIVIHELGHFLAARWAGIRTLAFAVGFGPALLSYRRGLGWRRGSSEPEHQALLREADSPDPARRAAAGARLAGIGSTEYRLNALPFGGYVKMLGQDDADPAARSDDPDSYQNCRPWKRMVVISAGVVANLLTAAALFPVVFLSGLRTETPRVGEVVPGRPAATAVAVNGAALGVTEPGLKPGDIILSIDGQRPNHFSDIVFATAMAAPGRALRFVVERHRVSGPLEFDIRPERDPTDRMLSIGVGGYASNRLSDRLGPEFTARFPQLKPGMTLESVDGAPAASAFDLRGAARGSGGRPVQAVFAGPGGERVEQSVRPVQELQTARVDISERRIAMLPHLAGLAPVLGVDSVAADTPAWKAGLKAGDVIASVGGVDWPSVAAGQAKIAASAGRPLELTVLRRGPDGGASEVPVRVARVGDDGRLGFTISTAVDAAPRVAAWPGGAAGAAPSGATLGIPRGSLITSVAGERVSTFGEVRDRLRAALAAGTGPITLEVITPQGQTERFEWTLTPEEASAVRALAWLTPLDPGYFEPDRFVWKASGIGQAIRMGLHEERRMVTMTYLTFARLFQGTVEVQQLKGPVGIAHVGVLVAEKGPVWLLFFMALVSVNLAVINFLPIPIADGGHMVFLVYEQITGKAPSVRVQNAAAIVGLVLLGTLFVIVTFHDVSGVYAAVRAWLSS